MMDKLSQINKISKYIFKYGLLLCLIIFVVTNYLTRKADYLSDILIARQIAGIGFYMIIEVVVGAVLFDVCIKNKN